MMIRKKENCYFLFNSVVVTQICSLKEYMIGLDQMAKEQVAIGRINLQTFKLQFVFPPFCQAIMVSSKASLFYFVHRSKKYAYCFVPGGEEPPSFNIPTSHSNRWNLIYTYSYPLTIVCINVTSAVQNKQMITGNIAFYFLEAEQNNSSNGHDKRVIGLMVK